MKKHLFAVIYGLALTCFTVYSLLDTFVIARVYDVPDQPDTYLMLQAPDAASHTDTEISSLTDNETEAVTAAEPVVTDVSYDNGNITINVTEYRYNDTDVYVADVVLSSPEYLKTAFAKATYGKNVTDKTSTTAEQNNAILAINGDYYGARESGYVIRSGVLYRDRAKAGTEDLVIYNDGSVKIINESDITAEDLLLSGAYNVLSFGPGLISEGKITVTASEEVSRAMASNPRTAIGVIDGLHYVFVVSDGRTEESEGLSLYELACFMKDLGCTTAYNLDGGGSSTMVFNGRLVNNPTTNGKRISERSVSDIVYIGY